jgi:hypothetical protein
MHFVVFANRAGGPGVGLTARWRTLCQVSPHAGGFWSHLYFSFAKERAMPVFSTAAKCPICADGLEACSEGRVQGLFCPSCDWSSLIAYPNGILEDDSTYQVKVTSGDADNYIHLGSVAQLLNVDLSSAKRMLQRNRPFVVFSGPANRVGTIGVLLKSIGLRFDINPPFPW